MQKKRKKDHSELISEDITDSYKIPKKLIIYIDSLHFIRKKNKEGKSKNEGSEKPAKDEVC